MASNVVVIEVLRTLKCELHPERLGSAADGCTELCFVGEQEHLPQHRHTELLVTKPPRLSDMEVRCGCLDEGGFFSAWWGGQILCLEGFPLLEHENGMQDVWEEGKVLDFGQNEALEVFVPVIQ